MKKYNHNNETSFTTADIEKMIGATARLPLTGRLVEVGQSDRGPFVLFEVDERWGFGRWRVGVDVEALDKVDVSKVKR